MQVDKGAVFVDQRCRWAVCRCRSRGGRPLAETGVERSAAMALRPPGPLPLLRPQPAGVFRRRPKAENHLVGRCGGAARSVILLCRRPRPMQERTPVYIVNQQSAALTVDGQGVRWEAGSLAWRSMSVIVRPRNGANSRLSSFARCARSCSFHGTAEKYEVGGSVPAWNVQVATEYVWCFAPGAGDGPGTTGSDGSGVYGWRAPNPTVVVATQPSLTATPMKMRCPHCGYEIMTRTTKTAGMCTYIMAGVCCVLCFPCVWVPFVVDTWKDTSHSCPNCNTALGERRMV
ncbi:hypothetical protein MTO96_043343 [Rhipicephalus appendiculatus]